MIEPSTIFVCIGFALTGILWARLIAAWKLEREFRESEATAIEQRDEALARIGHLETELSTAGGDLSRQQTRITELEHSMRELTATTLSAQTPETLGAVLRQAHGPMQKLVIHLDIANATLPRNDAEISRYLNERNCSIAILKSRDPSKLADLFIRTPTDWKRTTQTGTFELIAHGPCFSIGGMTGNAETHGIPTQNPEPIEPGHIRRRLI